MRIDVPETRYACDMALHDRFLGFSSDLLKLSLGGIGITGFLLTLIVDKGQTLLGPALRVPAFRGGLFVGIFCFAVSAGAALVHRFLASDGMYHHLHAIKLLIALEEERCPEDDRERLRRTIANDERTRTRKFTWSETALKVSATLLVLAGLSTGWAFITMFSAIPLSSIEPQAVSTSQSTGHGTTHP